MSRSFKYQGYEIGSGTEKISVIFLRKQLSKQVVQYLCYVLSLGILYEAARWAVGIELLQYRVTAQEYATHVLVTTNSRAQQILRIKTMTAPESALGGRSDIALEIKYFTFRHVKYCLEPTLAVYQPLEYRLDMTCEELHRTLSDGINEADLHTRLKLYGSCIIDVPVPSILSLLIKEGSHPFFVFQILSIILWIAEQYYYYAITIFILALGSLLSTIVETRKNMKDIRRMALHECEVEAKRGSFQRTRSRFIVPGDVVRVPENSQLPCDMILLEGSCLMDESMLTGESQPILKEALPKYQVKYKENAKHMLISGTKALSCRGECLGLVISTGFHTKKGELVRSILFPKPSRFKFYSDSIKFIGILTLISILGFLVSLKTLLDQKVGSLGLFFCSADLITIAVPPALPLAMSAGTAFAISRLKQRGISCISPTAVNSAGRVSVICFDKTGTLTEDSMKLKGVFDAGSLIIKENLNECQSLLQENLASCQSLVKLKDRLIGDPQEVAIFEKLSWEFFEPPDCRCCVKKGDVEISVVSLYHFSSETKRMGVVTCKNSDFSLHMKGAPEVMLPLCKDVPKEVFSNLLSFSQAGTRVLACGHKRLESFDSQTQLSEIEKDLEFLGLVLFHNPLKPETMNTLATLLEASIKCVISTGDALLTAAAVGKACGLIDCDEEIILGSLVGDEIAWENDSGIRTELDRSRIQALVVTGDLLEHLVCTANSLISYVLDNGRVYGRMSPNQKVLLVELLQKDQTQVAMVGDGANDCGALKAADVGLSILKPSAEQSSGEASIAAPFSAANLSDIVELLKEGRAALVTSFQCFKFITMYSMIQFICICFLYFLWSNLMDLQFLYEDLFMIVPLAVFMAYTGPSARLTHSMPPGALISVQVLSSIIGQILIQGAFQVFGFYILRKQSWYESQETLNNAQRYDINAFSPMPAYENTVLFLISSLQLLVVCISFSIGPPFRQPAYRNYYFSCTVIVIGVISFYLLVFPTDTTLDLLKMMHLDSSFKWMLLGIVLFGSFTTWIYERFGVNTIARIIRFNK